MGHGAESNVPWGTRTAIASARKLPSIRASQEIGIGLAMGFVGESECLRTDGLANVPRGRIAPLPPRARASAFGYSHPHAHLSE